MIEVLWRVSGLWWEWTSVMSLQIIVVVAAVWLIDRVLSRRVWPQMLAGLWVVALIKLVVPPGYSSPVSVARIGAMLLLGSSRVPGVPVLGDCTILLLFVSWCAGFIGLSLLAVCRYRRLRRSALSGAELAPEWVTRLAASTAARLRLSRIPPICLSECRNSPAVVGFWRPIVVLQAETVRHASRLQLEHALLHELAHVKRFDPISHLICIVLQLIYWFHPAVWLVRARLSALREVCCDQAVVAALGHASAAYRRTLLDFARRLVESDRVGWMGFIERRSQLLVRLDWLARESRGSGRARHALTLIMVGMLSVCLVPMGRRAVEATRAIVESSSEVFAEMTTEDLDELAGCLPRRFIVLGMLAEQERLVASRGVSSGPVNAHDQEISP